MTGPPGSGKSTTTRHLGAWSGLPVFHLDQAYRRPQWIAASPDPLRSAVERVASPPVCGIHGNCADTTQPPAR